MPFCIKSSNRLMVNIRSRAFNTQAIEYQQHFSLGSERLMLPFVEVEDVTYERMTHPYFLMALCEIEKEGGTADTFYEAVVPLLHGKASSREYGIEHLHYPQLSGTCSYAVFLASTPAMGDNSSARRLSFEFQTKAIHDYFSVHKDSFKHSTISQNITKKGLTAYVIAAQIL